MNSTSMKEMGFFEWHPLKSLSFSNLPNNKGSVFVIIDKTLSGKTVSDVMYIGRSNKPTKKILGYFAGYGGKTSKKINSKLFDEGYMDKTAISWVLSDNPKAMQKELLSKFSEEHGELPSWNAKKKPQERTPRVRTRPAAHLPRKVPS